jgi:hypothetical protein
LRQRPPAGEDVQHNERAATDEQRGGHRVLEIPSCEGGDDRADGCQRRGNADRNNQEPSDEATGCAQRLRVSEPVDLAAGTRVRAALPPGSDPALHGLHGPSYRRIGFALETV